MKSRSLFSAIHTVVFSDFESLDGGGMHGGEVDAFCCGCCFWESFSYKGFTFFKYFRTTSLALELTRLTADPPDISVVVFLCSFRKTEENFAMEKYLDDFLGRKLSD